jgi:hypothetical protein
VARWVGEMVVSEVKADVLVFGQLNLAVFVSIELKPAGLISFTPTLQRYWDSHNARLIGQQNSQPYQGMFFVSL